MEKGEIIISAVRAVHGMTVVILPNTLELDSLEKRFLNTFFGLANAMNLYAEYRSDVHRLVIYLNISYSDRL